MQKNHCDICDAVCHPPTLQLEFFRAMEPEHPTHAVKVYRGRYSLCTQCEARLLVVLGPLAQKLSPENGTEYRTTS